MLAEMVAAGTLPPVADRLPKAEDLLVIKPVHEIGKYGGTWRRGFTGPADGQNGHRVAAGDRFLFWDADEFHKQTPNLAKSWDWSEDGMSIMPLLQGKKRERGPIFWHYPHYGNQGGVASAAVRNGDWKLIEFYHWDNFELYDLATDPGEQNNLASEMPEVAGRLRKKLANWQEVMRAKMPVPVVR